MRAQGGRCALAGGEAGLPPALSSERAVIRLVAAFEEQTNAAATTATPPLAPAPLSFAAFASLWASSGGAQAFFGGNVSDATKESVHKLLVRNIEAFKRFARFAPYVAGDSFTVADCVAFSNLPLIGMATRAVYGEDLLLTAGVDYKPYLKLVGERPSAQKVVEDRKAEMTRAKT